MIIYVEELHKIIDSVNSFDGCFWLNQIYPIYPYKSFYNVADAENNNLNLAKPQKLKKGKRFLYELIQ